MTSWAAFEQDEPEFSARARRLLEVGRHRTLATLRVDGSPRISGIECEIVDGQLRFGSMAGSRKGADLRRDARFALHGPTFHPESGKEADWPGEVKIAGEAIYTGPIQAIAEPSEPDRQAGTQSGGDPSDDAGVEDPQPEGDRFVADIAEVVITGLNADATRLVIEVWSQDHGLRRIERDESPRETAPVIVVVAPHEQPRHHAPR